jgi:hypothetical protein
MREEILNVWTPDPHKQETLQTENIPGPFANEQSLPTHDEVLQIEGKGLLQSIKELKT